MSSAPGVRLTREFSSFLDFARWLAAGVVMIGHVRNTLLPSYSLMAAPSIFTKGFVFVAGMGRSAVIVFFVLSGFLVGGALARSLSAPHALSRYAVARCCRLCMVVIPVCAIAYGLGWFRLAWSAGADTAVLGAAYGVGPLLGTLAFLQNVVAPPFADNYPLWSLTNEFWYYVAFPMVLLGIVEWPRHRAIAAAFWTVAAGLLLLIDTTVAAYFVIWLVGAAASRWTTRRVPLWLALLVLALAVTICRLYFPGGYLPADLGVALGFVAVMHAMQTSPAATPWFQRTANWNQRLAGFSFTLYALHVPVIGAAVLVLTGSTSPALDPSRLATWGSVALVAAVAVAASAAVARFTEHYTYAIRSRVNDWIEHRRGVTPLIEGSR